MALPVLLQLIVTKLELNARFREHQLRLLSGVVFPFAHDAPDAAVDYQHRTRPARRHAAVESGTVDRDPALCSLTDSVLLGMNGPHTVLRFRTVFVNEFFHLVTDVVADRHVVHKIPGYATLADPRSGPGLSESTFGASGQGNGQFLFPNVAVTDSQGRVYVTDSNNGRISVWDDEGRFLFHWGQGSGDGALSLPRGALVDGRDRLYVVDAVGQGVKTYDVSGSEPDFLFAFGEPGQGNGQFNYPNDISLDATGRLYITDRENNRVQVWSY